MAITPGVVAAAAAVLALTTGFLRWANRKRWKGVRSADEQENHLRDRLEGSKYAGGPLSATVTSVIVEEDKGMLYKIKKYTLARISGSTEITMRFDRAAISEARLDNEPFSTVFSDPSEIGLEDAEHIQTSKNESQGYTLVQIHVYSIDYDEVGSWCSALPRLLWDAHEREQQM